MATKFGTFKHKMTGQVVTQPAHYGRLYPEIYTEVDPTDLRCVDCGVPEEVETPEAEAVSAESHTIDIYEPEPVKRTSRKNSAE